MGKISLEIYTKKGKYLVGEISSISLTTQIGQLTILPNHSPIIGNIEISPIILITSSNEKVYYATSGGVLSLNDNKITLLLDSIERSDEIDIDRANKSLDKAKDRISRKGADIDIKRAELSLKRALNRINVSSLNK